ncbi:glycoside hydrolase [Cutaneotrichosporon oleaginosum]|uniref:beta-N-acetylhexosaminidase n=1 Tax=Cutaneotrichosporon oleaginosum TaxID=879819 RepID=A0A0J0XDH2_9TREE|nr:glycoside hydrolase [Cutaneotrichosporon oleaginosum]KLT39140.1 glycoside hydrolase [Cutaneotrichosporon oleaginosum]TXT11323.1 hypothetical protein COLE_01733 [Cutaneotrichosporon oleaginosum]
MSACLLPPDSGALPYRGVMLDVCRHFLSMSEVRRMVEALALLKMNVLHLHLSDDQGWRFESLKWPKLTTHASTRPKTVVGRPANYSNHDLHPENYLNQYDDKVHSGFYSQNELRELVAFAKSKGITVVPEIDMPGHMRAARAAYPELGYNGVQQEVACSWGIFPEVLRVDEPGIQFAKDILGEICDVFDSPYIHIGGDECPKAEWAAADTARKQVEQMDLDPDHLDSYHKLQAWFTGEMAAFLASKGRKLLGWDEILDGGAPDGVVVMAWRDWTHAAERATKAGIPVVQAPSLLYFDYAQGPEKDEPLAIGPGATLEQVYAFDPFKGVPEERRDLVLGTQAQLWSEYIPTPEHLWYMAFPRLIALADVAYHGEKRDSYEDFLKKLPARVEGLKKLGIEGHPLP